MIYFPASALINFIASILFGFLIFIRNPRNKINYSYSLFAFGVAFWSICYFFWQISDNAVDALFWSKALMAFAIFVPAFYSHFVFVFTGLTKKKIILLIFAYILLGIFLPFDIFGSSFIREVKPLSGFSFWPIAGPLFSIFLTIWMGYVIFDTYLLYINHKKATGIYKNQIKYVFWGLSLAFLGGITNYFLWYEIPIPPVGNVLVTAYVTLTAIAIVRHRLMDIRLVLVRTITYAMLILIVGTLFALGLFLMEQTLTGKIVNSQELLISAILALFIALSFQPLRKYLEKVTDKIFYKGHYDSQELLKSLSGIMATTMELQLLTLRILGEVTQTIRIRRSVFALLSKDEKQIEYIEYEAYDQKPFFEKKDIEPFMQDKRITIFDDLEEGEIKEIMRKLNVSVALRLSVKDQKIGVLFLGEKSSGDIYSEQDIDILEILAPQLSVAIQNAREYEEIKRFNITLKDEIDKATKDLQNANEKLKQIDKVKDEFVSVASHELRTPMTIIKSYVWLLLNDKTLKLTDKQRTNLDRTYGSVERLIELVNDMLNVSRIESGRILIEPKPTDIKQLCEETLAEMQPKAREEKIDLSLEAEKNLPLVNIDPNKTKEIIINLVGNSLKFTPGGGKIKVKIELYAPVIPRSSELRNDEGSPEDQKKISRRAAPRNDNNILVSVSDTGFGIKAENMPKLFQKFGIVGENYLQKNITQGTGLGLYISKSIVELQGGKMWAQSEGSGKGATFSFTVKPTQN